MSNISRGEQLHYLKQLKKKAKINANTRNKKNTSVSSISVPSVINPTPLSKIPLITRLTTLQKTKHIYTGTPNGELFIHWYYPNRNTDTLSACETFHLNMLQYFDVMNRVEAIHIRCAAQQELLSDAMYTVINTLSKGIAKIDFKLVSQQSSWEHETFKESVEYAIQSGKFVYYTHFKAISRIYDPILKQTVRINRNATTLDYYYWCYLMYSGLFQDAPEGCSAIGPLLRDGINKSYQNRDISWSFYKTPHHYSGSFQGFDGKKLLSNLNKIGLSTKEARDKKLWINDPYAVEMFLTLAFPLNEVYFILCDHFKSYQMYKTQEYPYHYRQFINYPNTEKQPKIVPIKSKYAVLTYLFGEHKILRDPIIVDDDTSYVCVTDDPKFKAPNDSVWKVIYDPISGWNGRSKHMLVKFRPFKYVDCDRVVVMDSSIQIIGSIKDLLTAPSKGILLKKHPIHKNIAEELPVWKSQRGLTAMQESKIKGSLSIIGGTFNTQLYELDVSIWDRSNDTIIFGETILSMLASFGVADDVFPSNQMVTSLVAGCIFPKLIGVMKLPVPLIKYRHNSWNLNRRATNYFNLGIDKE